jgi:hypothetical protein
MIKSYKRPLEDQFTLYFIRLLWRLSIVKNMEASAGISAIYISIETHDR